MQPFEEHLRSVSTVTHQRDEYFALGLRQVATAVSFLSNDCKLVHGGVSMATVIVTDRLDWKLGGFDLVSDLQSVGRGTMGDARICFGYLIPPTSTSRRTIDAETGRPSRGSALGGGRLGSRVSDPGGVPGEPLGRTDQLRETTTCRRCC